jgi:transketolase
MVLTRQGLPTYRSADDGSKAAKGAYVLAASSNYPDVTLFASGSEVEIAMDARKELEAEGVSTRVVSVPCMELFFEQDESYRDSLLDNRSLKVAIEAGVRQGWDRIIGADGLFVGMTGFGESGQYRQLYKFFGITAEAVVTAVRAKRE